MLTKKAEQLLKCNCGARHYVDVLPCPVPLATGQYIFVPSIFGLGLFFLLLFFATPASAEPQPPPHVLFDAPINATWAANHGEAWREKGFSGFLFQGILDNLKPYPSEEGRLDTAVGAPVEEKIVPGDWEALLAEISGAVNRLKAAGLERNFLRLSLAPSLPYFTDAAVRKIAENRLQLAGECCRRTGLRGIALDTASTNGFYDYRWEGHPPDRPPEELSAGARQFARTLLRAFIRACPDGEILLLVRDMETAPPLWYSFLAGALESVGAADTIPISLVSYTSDLPREAAYYRNQPRTIKRLIKERASPSAYEHWDRQCGLSFAFEPVHYMNSMPTARYSIARYRHALYAAAINGHRYTIIHAPHGGWWHIPPDIAEQFSHLKQGGRARVQFAPPVPVPLDAYAPRLAVSKMNILGHWHIDNTPVAILQTQETTSAITWDGLPAALSVAARTGMVTVCDLITEEKRHYTPQNDHITIPAQPGLLLLRNVPPLAFALPASINMHLAQPLHAGVTRVTIDGSLYNPLPTPLHGKLSLTAGARYALGASVIALDVAPGETLSFQRTMQGISYLGTTPKLSANLHLPATLPITRTFSVPVEPPESFSLYTDGPVMGSALHWRPMTGKTPLLFIADIRGCLLCFDTATQHTQWHKRLRGTYTQPPVLLNGHTKRGPFIALQNTSGRIRLFDKYGTETTTVYLEKDAYRPLKSVLNHDAVAYLVAANNESISVYTDTGLLHNRFPVTDLRYVATAKSVPDCIYVITAEENTGKSPTDADELSDITLACYTTNGTISWESSLPTLPLCPLAIQQELIVLCDAAGAISVYNNTSGKLLASSSDARLTEIHRLACYESHKMGTLLIAVADNASVALLKFKDKTITELWQRTHAGATFLSFIPKPDTLIIGDKTGGLYGYDIEGKKRWEDHQHTGAITGITSFEDDKQKNLQTVVSTSATGNIRGITVRHTLVRPDKP